MPIIPARRALLCAALFFGALLATTGAGAKELRVVAPLIPPHFDERGRGRIGDVVRAVLAHCGHDVRYTMVPFGRHWNEYVENESFDGLATAEADQTFPGHSTEPFIHLQDGATVVVGGGLERLGAVEELAGKRIVAFPNAPAILGIEHLLPTFKSFKERTKRYDQLRPLLAGRADAVLADGLITAHFVEKLRQRGLEGLEPDLDTTTRVRFRRIFAKGPQRLYFRDPAVAADFDRCRGELDRTGEIERIAKPYVEAYRNVLEDQYPVR